MTEEIACNIIHNIFLNKDNNEFSAFYKGKVDSSSFNQTLSLDSSTINHVEIPKSKKRTKSSNDGPIPLPVRKSSRILNSTYKRIKEMQNESDEIDDAIKYKGKGGFELKSQYFYSYHYFFQNLKKFQGLMLEKHK